MKNYNTLICYIVMNIVLFLPFFVFTIDLFDGDILYNIIYNSTLWTMVIAYQIDDIKNVWRFKKLQITGLFLAYILVNLLLYKILYPAQLANMLQSENPFLDIIYMLPWMIILILGIAIVLAIVLAILDIVGLKFEKFVNQYTIQQLVSAGITMIVITVAVSALGYFV